MDIDYRIGDMFKGGHKYMAHGCNAQGVMGSGVARIVRDNYSFAYDEYVEAHEKIPLIVGELIPAVNTDGTTVFNCITQNKYGTDQRYANYGAIQSCIHKIDNYMLANVFMCEREVAFPMIGAGLAGGDWGIIAGIIERESRHFKPIVYDFTP